MSVLEAGQGGGLRGVVARLKKIDDGALLKATFLALLFGTAAMLILDYSELYAADGAAAPISPTANEPILPSIARPELDPNDPSLSAPGRVTTDPAVLKAPMRIELLGGGVLMLEGEIVAGTSDRLMAELSSHGEYVREISLNSPGGIVGEALEMGALIRAGKYSTRIEAGNLCASSCPLLLAAGTKRIVSSEAAVGVHQIFAAPLPEGGAAQALSDMQVATAEITRSLSSMGIDPGLWLFALDTPPDRLYYLSAKELLDTRLATAIADAGKKALR